MMEDLPHRFYLHACCKTKQINNVTASMKAGLVALRQVLSKAGFNYFKCCSSPMVEDTGTIF